jgi:hypothetical protein
MPTDLHCDQPLVHQHFLCEKIGTDGGFVTGAELLVDLQEKDGMSETGPGSAVEDKAYILVHETRLPNTAIPEDDNLESGELQKGAGLGKPCTFNRTFFREAMFA